MRKRAERWAQWRSGHDTVCARLAAKARPVRRQESCATAVPARHACIAQPAQRCLASRCRGVANVKGAIEVNEGTANSLWCCAVDVDVAAAAAAATASHGALCCRCRNR